MAIKSQKDFFSGLLFSVCGAAFALGARNYNIGEGARMGPGYFPLMLGIILAGLGLLIMVNAMREGPPDGDKIGSWAWKPLLLIIGANLVFGVLLGGLPSIGFPSFGLIVAIYAVVIISSMASEKFTLKGSLLLATVLAVGSYLAFIVVLKLQIPVWPSFIAG